MSGCLKHRTALSARHSGPVRPRRLPNAPPLLYPEVEHVVQVHVRELLVAPRSEAIRETEKIHFVDRVEHLDDCSLDHLVLQRGDPQRPLSTVGLRDVNAS